MLTLIERDIMRVQTVVRSVAAQHDLNHTMAPSESLVDAGFTSIAMVELMLAIEREFKLVIPDSDLNASNFSSILALASLLRRLGASSN